MARHHHATASKEAASLSQTRQIKSMCRIRGSISIILWLLALFQLAQALLTTPIIRHQQSYRKSTGTCFSATSTTSFPTRRKGSTSLLTFNSATLEPENVPELAQVDVLYGRRTPLVYDAIEDRYLPQVLPRDHASSKGFLHNTLIPSLSVAFLPQGVTPNYYPFIRWRVTQRFVNANLHVFGTQSLLLGLGLLSNHGSSSRNQKLALSTALNWVLKDALGKIVRMVWASRMGRRFDSDAKRWRFRSAYLYALGNALEIVTYLFPQYFLLWATLANGLKQISMLTSSSTRTAIYNSFRNGTDTNIGEITAKGEAQIAIVDLLGIASGVTLSRTIGMSARSIIAVYVFLQAMEITCMYKQLRCVQYRVFNFERLVRVISSFCDTLETNGGVIDKDTTSSIPTPQQIADTESIFFRPQYLSRRQLAFGSLERRKLSPTELHKLLDIFKGERFLLVVGRNQKQGWPVIFKRSRSRSIQWAEDCHVVLHKDATNLDIVKSTLALMLLCRMLEDSELDPAIARSSDCMDMIRTALKNSDHSLPFLLKQMSLSSWESPARSMFGRVHMRADWPLVPAKSRMRVNESAATPIT